METNIERTFAALSASNEAILYAKSPDELYEKVCEAAFSSGDFLATAVFLHEPGTSLLRIVAGFGEDIARLRTIAISIIAGTPEGSGLCGQAFREQRPCVSNDLLSDARSLAWREGLLKHQVGAAAALPLMCGGNSVGVLLVTRRKPGSLNEKTVSLLERMSANISFALENFHHEAERNAGERARQRLNRMFGAISATNEAILRSKTEQELYQRICDAAVHRGKAFSTVALLAEPGSTWLKLVAGTGEAVELITGSRFSTDPDNVYGTGVCGKAFRTQKPCINNDIVHSEQGRPWRQTSGEYAVACIAVPLVKAGQSVGVLMFFIGRSWAADEEVIAMMARMAENVSFALDNFERAQEKAKADQQKERLTRMFAALSATNEAIMRAKSRAELFELVCEAAVVGGKFTSTAIALERPGEPFLENVAAAGPDRERALKVQLSVDENRPEGHGITGTAFRMCQPCISNDYLKDFDADWHFYSVVRDSGTRSGAALPLLKDGKAIGCVVFLSSELGAFSPELIALLQRLAENVSFALANFDRAEEKARADEQKDRLTRMFAALSATNEAIMRAKSRSELFDLVCEAAAKGGRFNSTSIILVRPESDYLDMVASAGPASVNARTVRVSINAAHPEGRGLCGTAFRSGKASISNNFPADPRCVAFRDAAKNEGAESGAAFPLLAHGGARWGDAFHLFGKKHVFQRVCRTVATIGRQRLVRAGKLRPRRRKEQGGRTYRVSGFP